MTSRIANGLVAASLALALAVPALGQETEEKRQTVITQETTEITVRFLPVRESQIRGTAVILPLVEEEARFRPLRLELSGLTAEGQPDYPVKLYRGTCETGGTPIGEIGSVRGAETDVSGGVKITEADWKRAAERAEVEEEHAEKHAELAEEKRELEEEHAEEHEEEEEFAEAGLRHDALFIQVHAPDGTPVACGDLATETPLFVPGN